MYHLLGRIEETRLHNNLHFPRSLRSRLGVRSVSWFVGRSTFIPLTFGLLVHLQQLSRHNSIADDMFQAAIIILAG